MEMTLTQIRRIANQIAKGEQPGADREAERSALAEEARVYQELTSRPGQGHGWKVVGRQPLHRIEALNAELVGIIRSEAARLPLLARIERYGEMDWWVARTPVELTDAEIDSSPAYREAYDKAVTAGEAPPRPIRETDPGEEPSGGEMYRIAKALKAGLDKFPYPSPLQRQAGILSSSFTTGGTASQILERAFKGQHTPTIMFTLAEMAQVVPEVGRLVTWLEHGEAA